MNHTLNISINNAGKKFGKNWIFRNLNLEILPAEKIAILGLNGSGKSTLLQAISGYLTLNTGEIYFSVNDTKIDTEHMFLLCSFASPYIELIEDFTLLELIKHAAIYKPFMNDLTIEQVVEISGLNDHCDKYIHQFSSGMKQRLKLTLAILADVPVLLLDEPTSNLDAKVIEWYQSLIKTYAMHKTIIVCSNSIKEEFSFCTKTITMENFKAK